MHAYGQDIHTGCVISATYLLAQLRIPGGTLICQLQPNEESNGGTRIIVEDWLYVKIVAVPYIVLG